MFGRRCLIFNLTLLLILRSTLLDPGLVVRDHKIMAYDFDVDPHRLEEMWRIGTASIETASVFGAAIGATVGMATAAVATTGATIGGPVGFLVGAAAGLSGGMVYWGAKLLWCDTRCSKHLACVILEGANYACCADGFKRQCFIDWEEIEELFPIPVPTPPPIMPTFVPEWQEVALLEAPDKEKIKLATATFLCKRGRWTLSTNKFGTDKCPVESNQCFYLQCRDESTNNGHFAEWGCIPKNSTKFCNYVYTLQKRHLTCYCISGVPGLNMNNEMETIEGFYAACIRSGSVNCGPVIEEKSRR
ncbi:hypothetical protein GPALN_007411 [Globodera pallida]|nr:hypothetical protein GPALN_007411 [Globodera pallida]